MKVNKSIEAQAAFFEFYVRRIWPIHRLFVSKHYSKRCTRCAAAEEAGPLNEQGMCQLCVAYEKEEHNAPVDDMEAKKGLEDIFSSHEGKGKNDYDALVLFSGGKDSSFLLHKLKTDHPQLRVLALTVDNSFMSSVAMANGEFVARKLGVDRMIFAPKARVVENMMRYSFSNLRGHGCSETIDMLDGDFLIDQGRIIAATMHIPLLIIGYSHEQVILENLQNSTKYETREKRTTAAIYSLEEITLPEDMHYWWDGTKYREEDIPKVVFPFYAWNLSEEFIKGEVNRLGLIEGRNNSPLITNDTLIPPQGIVDVANIGYSSWEPEFTQMVREGKADKKFWQYTFELAQYSARRGNLIDDAAKVALKRLQLTPKDVGLDKLNNKW